MFITIDGLKIHFNHFTGDNQTATVLLHGWGCSGETMQGVFNSLVTQNKQALSVDLPYFGKSDTPPADFTVYDYALIVKKMIDSLGFKRVNLIGHSFGGRLSIILGANYKDSTNKIILVDSAGLKPKRSLKYRIKVSLYKIKKRLKIKQKNAGSTDYNALPDNMKKVFVNIVNTHLDKLVSQITAPTLIIWGKDDLDTPLYMAKKLNKKIANSGLVVLEDAGHYSFLDKPQHFYNIINSFL